MDDKTPSLPAGLSAPAIRALTAAGYRTVDDLRGRPSSDLLALHGVGPKAIRIIDAALAAQVGEDG